MRKILLAVATMAATMCMSVSVFGALSVPATIDVSNMDLQWSDEFNGTSLNTDYWTPEIGNGNWGWGNGESQYYKNSEDNITVSDGTLKLTARSETEGNYKYTSGRIKTADKVEVGYGYVEARIKLPSVNGVWPAFWMLGANEPKGWPYCGEIDIMEAWNTGDFAQNCFHYADADGNDNYDYLYRVNNIGKTEWHTYGVYKTKEKLVFYYDGKVASKVIDITNDEMTEAHNNYYILLNVACGGTLTGFVEPNAASLPATMEVDYVRYYTDKTASTVTSTTATPETTTQATVTTPKKAVIKSLKNKKGKKMKITIKKIAGVNGFRIRYCENKKFKGYVQKNTTKRIVTIKKLVKKQTYYVKVRAYKKVNGKKVWGAWSKVKKVKIKK